MNTYLIMFMVYYVLHLLFATIRVISNNSTRMNHMVETSPEHWSKTVFWFLPIIPIPFAIVSMFEIGEK
jgi:hypothetical protein